MTLDTKEGLDFLMSNDGQKTFTLSNDITGTHYRFKSQKNNNQNVEINAST